MSNENQNVSAPKKYGLVIQKQSKQSNLIAKPQKNDLQSLFFNPSDEMDGEGGGSEDEEARERRQCRVAAQNRVAVASLCASTRLKSEDKLAIKAALSEDQKIFDYDDFLEDREATRKAQKNVELAKQKNHQNQLEHFNSMVRSSKQRKLERELALIKHNKQENLAAAAANNEQQEKPAYITKAYRERLGEMDELQREMDKEKQKDDLLDVKKHGFGAFGKMLYADLNADSNANNDNDKNNDDDDDVIKDGEAGKKQESREKETEIKRQRNDENIGRERRNLRSQRHRAGDSEDEAENANAMETQTERADGNAAGNGDGEEGVGHDEEKDDATGEGEETEEAPAAASKYAEKRRIQEKIQEMIANENSQEQLMERTKQRRLDEDAREAAKQRFLARKNARHIVARISQEDDDDAS